MEAYPMSGDRQEPTYRMSSVGQWKVISTPGAPIHVEELEMTDEIKRNLTADDVTSLPAPRLERYRRYWNLPKAV
jgi:hypothetical protein